MRNLVIGSFLLSLAGAIWGGMFIAVRIAVAVIPPIELVWMRFGTALIALLCIMFFTKQSFKIERKDWKHLFIVSFSGYLLSIVVQETGTMLTSAQMGALVTAATPAFMVIFGCFLLHERLTLGRVLSVILATAGVLLITFDPENVKVTPLGCLCLVAAAVTWAYMSVVLKFLSKYSPIAITFYAVFFSFITLTPLGMHWLMTEAEVAKFIEPKIILCILYLGLISTTTGFILWNKGLTYMDAAIGGLFMFFQPIVGALLGWLFLDEEITLLFWIGFLLIAVGILLTLKKGNTTAAEKLVRARNSAENIFHTGQKRSSGV